MSYAFFRHLVPSLDSSASLSSLATGTSVSDQLERKKDGRRNGVKGDDASRTGNLLPSPTGAEFLHGYHPVMEHPNEEHHTMTSGGALGGGAHFMRRPPQVMHMTPARPSEWGYDLSGMRGNGLSENG
ncbi:hypothetical protein Bca4012_041047 [Brassica carinata]|uniref:AT-hook motif nuclear-localized protein n=5 Tax=Brassica TaxID=3705 RepID=A0ABQ7XMD8_BRANA|nr:PREDICTED: AT-hook motif nuclear-localized protein 14-like isoform X2 [Brassica oleracea var. oleracea]XP_013607270.1 PREDICTED: AT-hook motif nuclear-localized protein 14-like isoform X2 [Brassica oleracea var. oleracea]XP_022568448.1 AT-hook motif nuclear-localized protein 14-like [Brassica napus]XP_048625624.1 AT-hook motif nuclear-localized protein 14-like [Brassica napus]KAG2278643.1 hypothetical protein Bca52824_061198 [Brassica carinata]KAH0856155.1 hypothetical protein HID58_084416 